MDLRGHGNSFQTQKKEKNNDDGNDNNNNYDLASTFEHCTQDIDYTLKEFHSTTTTTSITEEDKKVPAPTSVLVGHSFGGRLALEYAANIAKNNSTNKNPLKAVWLLDTVPGQANDSVDRVLATITDVLNNKNKNSTQNEKHAPPLTKKEMTKVLTQAPYDMDLPTAQWLAMSYDDKSGDNFGFDNDLVTRLKPEFANQDFMGMLRRILEESATTGTHIHVVRGGKNTGWSIQILSELEKLKKEFPSTFHLHVLPSAGHNVHIDDMKGLVKLFAGT